MLAREIRGFAEVSIYFPRSKRNTNFRDGKISGRRSCEFENLYIYISSLGFAKAKTSINIGTGKSPSGMNMLARGGKKNRNHREAGRPTCGKALRASRVKSARSRACFVCVRECARRETCESMRTHRLTKIDKGWSYEPISAAIQCLLHDVSAREKERMRDLPAKKKWEKRWV